MARGSIRSLTRQGADGKTRTVYQARVPAGTSADGTRRQMTKTHRTKTEAQRWITEQLARAASGQRLIADAMTVADLLARWLPLHEREVRPSTAASDRWAASVILPELGRVRLDKLDPLTVQAFYDGLRGRLKPSSMANLHRVFAAALKQAVAWELIPRNPATATRRPKVPKSPKKGWTAEQAQCFLAQTRDDFDGALYAVLLWTGMRIGEAVALDWRHVDLVGGWVSIERSMTVTAEGEIVMGTAPKTASSRRRIPLAVPLQAALVRQRQRQDERRQEHGSMWRESGAVFDGGDGTRRTAGAARSRFVHLIARMGLPKLNPHGCRHTCATLLVARGVSPKKVQEILGHSSITTTLDMYVHLGDEEIRSAADALEAVLGDPPDGERAPSVAHERSDGEQTA